jgi:hypothetical protein
MAETREELVVITAMKISKPFLKVFARKKRSENMEFLKKELVKLYARAPYSLLTTNANCIVKLGNDSFERCRILKISHIDYRATILCYDTGLSVDLTPDKVSL